MLSRNIAIIGWVVSTALAVTVLFSQYVYVHHGVKEGIPTQLAGAYNSMARTAFSISIAWVVFSCHYGYGWVANTILSWRLWLPLGRLTFSFYVMHMIVLQVLLSGTHVLFYMNGQLIVMVVMSVLVVTLATAFVMTLCYELPIPGMERAMLLYLR